VKCPCRICFEISSNGGKHWVTFQKRKGPFVCRTWPWQNLLPPNGTDDKKGARSDSVGMDWAHSRVHNNNNSFLFISTHSKGKLLCCGQLDFCPLFSGTSPIKALYLACSCSNNYFMILIQFLEWVGGIGKCGEGGGGPGGL